MDSRQIVDVVGELVVDDGESLERRHGSRALAAAREIQAQLERGLQENDRAAAAWRRFQQAPELERANFSGAVQMVLQADAALVKRLGTLLEAYQCAEQPTDRQISTGGGAYVEGDVSVSGGDFVGRDKTTITGDGNVTGDRSSATVVRHTGIGADDVAALFDQALTLARQRPPEVREDLEAAVETVQEETEAGEEVDKRLLNKALDVLLEEGPDVLEIVLEAVLNPAAAAGKGARMLARQAKRSLAKQRGAT